MGAIADMLGAQAASPTAPPRPMGGIAGIVASQAALPATAVGPAPADHASLGGFLGNVVSGVEGLATGLGQLVGAGVHDLARVASLGTFDSGSGSELGHALATAPSAIWQDEKARWGPLFSGHFGDFAHQLYSKPVSFGLDALTVASAGATAEGMLGKAVVKGAEAASTAGADAAAAVAAGTDAAGAGATSFWKGAGATADAAKQLIEQGIVPKTARAVAIRQSLESLAAGGTDTGLAGTFKNLLPTTSYAREGDILKLVAKPYNPLTRFVADQTVGRLSTTPIDALQTALDASKTLGPYAPSISNKLNNLQSLYDTARSAGMTRVENQRVGDLRASAAGRAINKFTSGQFFKDRLAATHDVTQRWLGVAKVSTPTEAAALDKLIMGLDVRAVGLPMDPNVVLRSENALGDALHPIEMYPKNPAPLLDTLNPASVTANLASADPAIAASVPAVQNILAAVDKTTAKLESLRPSWDQVQPGYVDKQLQAFTHLKHDLVSEQNVLATPIADAGATVAGARPWQHGLALQRIQDVQQFVSGWDTFEQNAMPTAFMDPAWRPTQWMHGAETVIGGQSPKELALAAQTKLDDYMARKSQALFNKQTFDAPLAIQDAQNAVQKALDSGTNLPKVIQKAQADLKRYTYSGPGVGSDVLTGPGWQDFHAAYRTAGRQSPAYYPFIEADHVSAKNWFMSRQLKGAVQFAEDKHNRFNTGALFKAGDYVTNPADAYARRLADSVRMEGTARMINAYLDRNARPITKESQLASGEVVMSPMLTNMKVDIHNAFRSTAEDLQLAGTKPADAAVSALQKVHADTLNNVATQLADGSIKMYAVPEAMAKHMNDAAKWAGIVPRIGKLYVDGPMNIWRSLVLAGSPRWIVNNVLGNTLFTGMQGGSISRALVLMEQEAAKALNDHYGWKLPTGSIDAIDKFLTDNGLYSGVAGSTHAASIKPTTHIPVGSEQGLAGRIITHSREAPGPLLRPLQKFSSIMRDANSGIEAAFRRNSFLTEFDKAQGIGAAQRVMRRYTMTGTGIEKLLKDGLSPGSAKAALDGVNHFFGDFANLGPLERNIIRPYIAPFWGFYKFQTKLFLSYPFQYPARAELLAGLAHVQQDLTSAYGPLPDWLQGSVPAGPPGSNQWITSSGPNPFNGLFQSPLGQLSPMLKIPVEHFTGRSLFTGRKFTDANTVTPYGSDQQFHIVRDAQGNPIDVTPINKVTPGLIETLLSQVPQYQEIKSTLAGGTTYDTSNIIDALKGNATVLDPATGLPKYPTGVQQQLMKYLGVPITNYDVTSYQTFLAAQKKAAMAEALKRAGATAP